MRNEEREPLDLPNHWANLAVGHWSPLGFGQFKQKKKSTGNSNRVRVQRLCAACGARIDKWTTRGNEDRIRYCSIRCRKIEQAKRARERKHARMAVTD